MSSENSIVEQLGRLQAQIHELRSKIRQRSSDSLPTGPFDVLVCALEGERIALELSSISEVVQVARLSALPEAPPWAPGILTLRGHSIPVIDVVARMNRGRREVELSDLIVIAAYRGQRIGLLVQEVLGVERLDPRDIQPAGADIPHAPYLAGISTGSDRLVLLLDLSSLVDLSDVPEVDS